MENEKIDFIITWVDGNDDNWRKEKNKFEANIKGRVDSRDIRYRDWDNLKYWFRGVEKFAPWVNNVYFVTWGHIPKWLNINHPKLRIVKHSDFIPIEYLPTFNANPIENNMHRIKGLSNHFVFFNDDMFLIKSVKPSDFFYKGLPRDMAVLNPHISRRTVGNHIEVANMDVINANFNKSIAIKSNFWKWFNIKYGLDVFRTICLMPWNSFVGIYNQHLPNAYCKTTFEEVWEKEYSVLDETCKHKFRTPLDVNQWLFQDWQIASGKFYPRNKNFGKNFNFTDNNAYNNCILECIRKQKYKMICINDSAEIKNFDTIKKELCKTFDVILPNKSEFELEE